MVTGVGPGGVGGGRSVSFICYSVHVCAVQLSPAVHRPLTGAAGVSVHATFSDLAVPPLKLQMLNVKKLWKKTIPLYLSFLLFPPPLRLFFALISCVWFLQSLQRAERSKQRQKPVFHPISRILSPVKDLSLTWGAELKLEPPNPGEALEKSKPRFWFYCWCCLLPSFLITLSSEFLDKITNIKPKVSDWSESKKRFLNVCEHNPNHPN